MTRASRRNGLSLVEVLTALFILALGVVAILTMFPLGASQMAIAVKENRSMEAAFSADQQMRSYWKHKVVEVNGGSEPFYIAMTTPNVGSGTETHPPALPVSLPPVQVAPFLYPTVLGEPSYTVCVDPMGYAARGLTPASQVWVGDGGATNVPRRSLNDITSNPLTANQLSQRWCSAMDGLGYSDDGVPNPDREMRYNWLWFLQLPDKTNRFTANMLIVTFDRRAHMYAPAGSETVYQSTLLGTTPGTSSVTFTSAPDIKPGGWVFDLTVGTGASKMRNMNAYRVTAVNGNTLELQSPIKNPTDTINSSLPYTGTFVVMRGVSGVYTRPPLTPGD
jgi:hypothetical protein